MPISTTKPRLILDFDAAQLLGLDERAWALAHLSQLPADGRPVDQLHATRLELLEELGKAATAFRRLVKGAREEQ